MPTTVSKLDTYQTLAHDTAAKLAGNCREWLRFLSTASRLYKYPFHEQLLIHAQRPRATACADYNCWQKHMGRYVRGGASGIALIRRSRSGDPAIRYVFDIADTGRGANPRRPFLWQYREEHAEAVASALERRFEVPGGDGLTGQLAQVAAQSVDTYWQDFRDTLTVSVRDSQLENLDADNIGLRFRNAATVSVSYVLLTRCGVDLKGVFTSEDFQCINEFDSVEAITTLGVAVSTISEDVLRTVENAIRAYELEKLNGGAAGRTPTPAVPEAESAPPPDADSPATDNAAPKRAGRKRKTPVSASTPEGDES